MHGDLVILKSASKAGVVLAGSIGVARAAVSELPDGVSPHGQAGERTCCCAQAFAKADIRTNVVSRRLDCCAWLAPAPPRAAGRSSRPLRGSADCLCTGTAPCVVSAVRGGVEWPMEFCRGAWWSHYKRSN
jgi:hypothetical protein